MLHLPIQRFTKALLAVGKKSWFCSIVNNPRETAWAKAALSLIPTRALQRKSLHEAGAPELLGLPFEACAVILW